MSERWLGFLVLIVPATIDAAVVFVADADQGFGV